MKEIVLAGKCAVITGASSGIGKATALCLARQGVNLVVAARRELLLEDLALACERLGVTAFAYKMDVTSLDQVKNLFEFALEHLGQIDFWINNAGVGAVGEFTQVPMDVHERVIKTNLLGYMYGAYAVMPYFKDQGRGTLINNNSLGAFVPNPFAVSYSASKFGLRGFSEALRYELVDHPLIRVCDVFPAFVDTPGFQHGANYSGKELKPAPPVYEPEQVAGAILRLCRQPKDHVMVGASGRVARIMHGLTPKLLGHLMARVLQNYFKGVSQIPDTTGNLFKPMWDGIGIGIRGGWKNFHPLRKLLKH